MRNYYIKKDGLFLKEEKNTEYYDFESDGYSDFEFSQRIIPTTSYSWTKHINEAKVFQDYDTPIGIIAKNFKKKFWLNAEVVRI
ncbi:hypothetical protein F943_02300 [Acinetobacter ursingii NIPH 706]|uniref:Uncharacterized protein n=3 Tax=Moraxellaceae TaxID=468 RepID=A0A7T9UL63_9GAMM|nr:hypothetical protein [Acinetobacter ursingii]ENX48763.1 hypothetical protein F943_02300 [Acinetobacter ursingii NIPH 706]EXD37904.1 hypothetical protein J500_0365 [Acinetobacter sp. 479375]MCH2014700.1 hypothetical protein [Acinetobacter ursingii]MCU4522569.1 hypothetical protein [Acinetobacter ursingii]MCU4587410.1 hypothetical protein [Acinetobacter ursingii]